MFWILLIALLVKNCATDLVTVECLKNCNIDHVKDAINGEVGDDVTFKFTVHQAFDIISLQYDGIPILVATPVIYLTIPSVHEFDFGNKSITSSGDRHSVIITLRKLDINTQDEKELSFILVYDKNKLFTTAYKTYVHDGPYMIGEWETDHIMEDDTTKDIVVKIYANPKPIVTASVGSTQMKVSDKDLGEYTYDYTTELHVNRTHCGKNITLDVVGYLDLSLSAKIHVLFTPWKPSDVYAYFSFKGCLFVSWSKIESGNCPVTYTVQYSGSENIEHKTNALIYHRCGFNASVNDTVSVRAKVNDRISPFSSPVNVVIASSLFGKGEQKGQGLERWDLYVITCAAIFVFIGIIVWVLIMFFCKSRKSEEKKSTGSNTESLAVNNHPEGNSELWPQDVDDNYETISDKWTMLSIDMNEMHTRNVQEESEGSPKGGSRILDAIKTIAE